MLDNEDFITWANENVVVVLGHRGGAGGKEQHKPAEEKDAKTGDAKPVCPLYPGLTCAEHEKIREDAGNGGKDGIAKIDVPSGHPNSWMIGPDGKVEKIEKQTPSKEVMDALIAYQKTYAEKPVAAKKYGEYRKAFDEGDKALEDGKFKVALAALVKVDKDAKKLTSGLVEKVTAKVEALNGKVAEKFAALKDGDGDAAAKLKSVKALRSDVSAKLSTGALPVTAEIDAWVKEAAAAAAAK